MDKLDFLDGETPVETTAAASPEAAPAPEPTAQAAAETPPETEAGPARGPDGKFVAKTNEAPPAPTPEPAPQAQPEPKGAAPEGYVPLSALTELRREFSAFRQQVQQAPPQPAPDPYEDFEAYQAWQETQAVAERADWSFQLAAARHGEAQANEVKAWAAERFASDPVFAQRAMSSRDPYGVAFAEYQQHQALQMLADPTLREKFQAFLSGNAAPTTQAAPTPPPQQPVAPPPSITSAPSAGGVQHTPTGPGQAYGAIFG